MDAFEHRNVIQGGWGELWLDGEYLAEVISFEATVEQESETVNQCGGRPSGEKPTGRKGEGTIKLHKVSSLGIRKMSDKFKKNQQVICTIDSKLADPDALGTERVTIKNATFKKLTLASWEAAKLGEEEFSFSFSDWDIKEVI